MSILERWLIFGGAVGTVGMAIAVAVQTWKIRAQAKLYEIEHELRLATQHRAQDLNKTLQSAEFLHSQQVVRLESANRFLKSELAERERVLLEIAKRDPQVLALRLNALGRGGGSGMPEKANGARADSHQDTVAVFDDATTAPGILPGGNTSGG